MEIIDIDQFELIKIASFTQQSQVDAYSSFKENKIKKLELDQSHERKTLLINRTAKTIMKLVSILSAVASALTIYIETFLA